MTGRNLVLTRFAVLVLLCLSSISPSPAAAVTTFDFNSGVGPEFEVVNDGNLWTVGTSGPDVPISKPADPSDVNPNGFVSGGIQSLFCIDGDFTVTVDYLLVDFSVDGSTPLTLNEAVLRVVAGPASFLVLRYARGDGQQRIEGYNDDGQGEMGNHGTLGDQPSNSTSGRFRITRVGSVLSGYFASAGSEDFTNLGSMDGYAGAVQVTIYGAQVTNCCGERANTSLEVHFDNLIVDPDPDCVATRAVPTTWGQIKSIYR